jgi:threonine synthase
MQQDDLFEVMASGQEPLFAAPVMVATSGDLAAAIAGIPAAVAAALAAALPAALAAALPAAQAPMMAAISNIRIQSNNGRKRAFRVAQGAPGPYQPLLKV